MRYELIKEPKGTWTVWDSHARKPADYHGFPKVHLKWDYALDVHAILESLHLHNLTKRRNVPW